MKKTRIYLSGNMTPDTSVYYKWIEEIDEDLKDTFDLSYSIAKKEFDSRLIVRHDLARLRNCDVVLVNLGLTDLNHHLTGAVVEIYEAYRLGKPVYAFCSEDLKLSSQANSPWVNEFITKFFNSQEELIDYLLCDENITVDYV